MIGAELLAISGGGEAAALPRGLISELKAWLKKCFEWFSQAKLTNDKEGLSSATYVSQ